MENNVASPCPWPWLVFLDGEKLKGQVFYDLLSNPKITSITKSIPELKKDFMIPTNIDGWFLLNQGDTQICLWNTVTLRSIDLPHKLEELEFYHLNCGFLTKSPNDRDCVILLSMKNSPKILYCHVYGDDHWILRNYEEELMKFRDGREYSEDRFSFHFAYGDDNIFMISLSNVLAKIEIVKPKRLVIRPDISFPGFRMPHSHVVGPCRTLEYLVAWCNELFVIHVSSGGMNDDQISSPIVSIDVFKLDFSDKSWKIVDSCPNAAFFISDKQCLACTIASTDSTKVGNQVYIIECNHYDDCLFLYTYHLQQKTLKKSLIATPKDKKIEPYWMLVHDAQALTKTEDDYHNGGDEETYQLFVKRENTYVMVQADYEDKEKKVSIMLDDIHVDILKIIISHFINPLDYLNFRSINRSCRELGSAKEWRNITSGSNSFFISSSPWLIFPNSQQVGKGLLCMVNPVLRNTYYMRMPETLEENSRICYSAYGWLLMSSPYLEDGIVKDLNLVLYNPITKSRVCLPKIPEHAKHFFFHATPNYPYNFVAIAISIDEPKPNYYILELNSDEDESDIDETDQEWEWAMAYDMTKDYEDAKFFVRQSNVDIIFIDDVYYFLVGGGNIAYFIQNEYIVKIHSMKEPCNKSLYERYFLARCDKDLLSIYIGKEWKWLRAFKFNKSDKVWDEVEELKNNSCLYMSYVSSTTSEPQSPEVGNRIYFSIFYQGSVVYYSFNTRKFHLSDGNDSIMSDYQRLEEQMYSCWFQPRWDFEE